MDHRLRWTAVLVGLALTCTVLLAAQTWSGQFLSDDAGVIWRANQVLSQERVTSYLLGSFISAEGAPSGFYRPIGLSSWILNAWISGVDPTGWRIANLLLHLLNGWLVYRLVVRLADSKEGRATASLAAAAFWLYPLAPEVSVWIAGRYDLLAMAGALFACERHLASRRLLDAARLQSLAALAFALGSKEAAITAPAMFFLLGLAASEARPNEVKASRWFARSILRGLRDCLPALVLLFVYFLLRRQLFGDAVRVYSGIEPLLAFEPMEFLRRLDGMAPVVREPFGAAAIWLAIVILGVLGTGFAAAIRCGRWLRWWLLPGLATILSVLAVLVHFTSAESIGMGARLFYASGAWLAVWLFLPFSDAGARLPRTLCAAVLLPVFAFFLSLAIAPWRDAGLAMRKLLPAITQLSTQLDAHNEFGIVLVPDHLRNVVFARNARGIVSMGGLLGTNLQQRTLVAITPLDDEKSKDLVKLGIYPVPEGKTARFFCFDAFAQDSNAQLLEMPLATPMTESRVWWHEWSSAIAGSPCAGTYPDLK